MYFIFFYFFGGGGRRDGGGGGGVLNGNRNLLENPEYFIHPIAARLASFSIFHRVVWLKQIKLIQNIWYIPLRHQLSIFHRMVWFSKF